MAVSTNNLTHIVLQAIETWSSKQNHDLGYTTRDQGTGKTYRYVIVGAVETAATPGAIIDGTPLGPYIADANATATANYVSAKAHLAQGTVLGVSRGACATANYYGFMEVAEPGGIATVNVTHAAIICGDMLSFGGSGYLESVDPATIGTSAVAASIVAVAIDSHRASYTQGSVLMDATLSVTPICVKWL